MITLAESNKNINIKNKCLIMMLLLLNTQGKVVILFSSLVLLNFVFVLNFVYVIRYIIKYNMLTTNKRALATKYALCFFLLLIINDTTHAK